MRNTIKRILKESINIPKGRKYGNKLQETLNTRELKHKLDMALDIGDYKKVVELSKLLDDMETSYDEPLIKRKKPKTTKKEPIKLSLALNLLIKDVMNTNEYFYNDLKKYSHNYGNYKNWWKDNRDEMVDIAIVKYDDDFMKSIKKNNVTLDGFPNVTKYIVTTIIEKFFDDIRTSKPYKNYYQRSYGSIGPADVSELWVQLFGEPKESDFEE